MLKNLLTNSKMYAIITIPNKERGVANEQNFKNCT